MKWLKDNWQILAMIFAVGGAWTTVQYQLNEVTKISRQQSKVVYWIVRWETQWPEYADKLGRFEVVEED